ncbi:MAG: DUF4381 domain-containing protein [Pseudomonadota bacterium]
MKPADEQVDQLPIRDIHLPDPVSWWPPGPLWWLLLAIALVFLAWALRALYRRWQARPVNYRPSARGELAQIRRQWQNGELDHAALGAALNQLLRRLLRSEAPQYPVGQTGDAWLATLGDFFHAEPPSVDCANALTRAAYVAHSGTAPYDAEAVIDEIEGWLKSKRRSPGETREERHAEL